MVSVVNRGRGFVNNVINAYLYTMPLPKKKKGEKKQDYLKRCIPVEIKAGKGMSQAIAICSSEYERQKKAK